MIFLKKVALLFHFKVDGIWTTILQEEDVNKLLDSIVQFEDQLGGESSGEDETFLVTDPQAYKSRKSSKV